MMTKSPGTATSRSGRAQTALRTSSLPPEQSPFWSGMSPLLLRRLLLGHFGCVRRSEVVGLATLTLVHVLHTEGNP